MLAAGISDSLLFSLLSCKVCTSLFVSGWISSCAGCGFSMTSVVVASCCVAFSCDVVVVESGSAGVFAFGFRPLRLGAGVSVVALSVASDSFGCPASFSPGWELVLQEQIPEQVYCSDAQPPQRLTELLTCGLYVLVPELLQQQRFPAWLSYSLRLWAYLLSSYHFCCGPL